MKNIKPKQKILLVGKSGSGKNTVQDYLVNKYGLKPLVSYTTRARRYPEEDTHTFITEQEYEEINQKEKIIAYTFYNGNHYFATEKQFRESDIYIIDLYGLWCIDHLDIGVPYIAIYLDVPSNVRAERMAARGDSPEMILERIKLDDTAFAKAHDVCQHTIINDDSEETARSIARLVGIEKYEFDIEREVVDKLKQIQTLLRRVNPDIDNIKITLSNCSSVPLSEDNNLSILCSTKRNEAEYLFITTIDRNHQKWLTTESRNQPNRLDLEQQTVRIN